jgi:hypothetical protein
MRSVTHPLFPAQAGAVTLQDVIDAREGDRLPLELALYVSGEVGRQVSQLQAQGPRAAATATTSRRSTRCWAVVVHEAIGGKTDPHALSDLVYRLLSGSGDVSAWPPSYFNPSVAETIDAAVMKAVAEDQPEARSALLDVVRSAADAGDPESAVDGMARLVYAVPDEPKKAFVPKRTSTVSDLMVPQVAPPSWFAWFTPQRTAIAAGVALLVVLIATVFAASGRKAPAVAAPVPAAVAAPAVAPVELTPAETRLRTVEAYRATKQKPAKPVASKRAIAKRK